MRAPSRLVSLDLLRAIAVLLVIGRHVDPAGDPALVQAWNRGGWVGVDLFFVLSGFLVSGLLFREQLSSGTVRSGRFLIRRALKIYPAFYAFVLINLTVSLWRFPTRGLIGELLFLQNYVGAMWYHTWSLAVEEHFYLGIALLVAGLSLSRLGLAKMEAVMIGLAVGCLAARLLLPEPFRNNTHLYPTHLRADSLGFGVLLSYSYHFRRDLFERLRPFSPLLIGLGAAALAPAFIWPLETPFIHTWGLTLFYLGSGSILTGLLLSRLPESRVLDSIALIGAYSYSIYLWHFPVIRWFSLDSVWIAIPCCVIAGVAMARIVEFPVLRLRDRFFPSAVPTALGTPSSAVHSS